MKFGETLYICESCVKDPYLKEYYLRAMLHKGRCCICKKDSDRNVKVSDNKDFSQIFKALIRYHFTEDQYNGHWGGHGIESLFEEENPILNHHIVIETTSDEDELLMENVILTLIDEPFEDYDKGVSIYLSPHKADGYYAETTKKKESGILSSIERKLKTLNYYKVEPQAKKLLRPYVNHLKLKISTSTVFHRARIGVAEKAFKGNNLAWEEAEKVVFPFIGPSISAPPPPISSTGRLNRPGISFLYLASDTNTGICEIKPHPGQIVSVGEFKPKRDLSFANLMEIKYSDYWSCDKDIDIFVFLKNLNKSFATPIAPHEIQSGYLIMQFIANVLRKLHFDGVAFKSSVTDGANFVVFDPDAMSYVTGSGKCFKIDSLSYIFSSARYELERDKSEDVWYYPG